MKRVAASVLIAAPVERVWKVLYEDMEHTRDWVPFVQEVTYVSGPEALGQVYRERTRLGPVTGEQEWRIIEWEPPRRQVQESLGVGMEARLVITVEPAAVGSLVRQESQLTSRLPVPGALRWMHEELVGRVARSGLRAAMRGAKGWVEEGKSVRDSERTGGQVSS